MQPCDGLSDTFVFLRGVPSKMDYPDICNNVLDIPGGVLFFLFPLHDSAFCDSAWMLSRLDFATIACIFRCSTPLLHLYLELNRLLTARTLDKDFFVVVCDILDGRFFFLAENAGPEHIFEIKRITTRHVYPMWCVSIL